MRFIAYLVAALALAAPALAEPPKDGARLGDAPAAKDAPPHDLNFLFDALKAAPTPQAAKSVEEAIWRLWLQSGSSTVDLLMTWAVEAVAAQNTDLALRYLDTLVELKPDFAEGWNKRATVHFRKHDYARAMADLQRVLALEPRHFAAWNGLGVILQDTGDKKHALEAFRKALAIDPHLEAARKAVDALGPEVEGQEL